MKRAVFLRFFALIMVSLLLCGGAVLLLMGRTAYGNAMNELLHTAALADYGFDYTGDLSEECRAVNGVVMTESSRITVLDTAGQVLADSSVADPDELRSHAGRPEVTEALEEGSGFARRYSETLGREMLYAARVSKDGNYVLRLAVPYDGLSGLLPMLIPGVLIGIVLSLAVSLSVAGRFSATITGPLTEISGELMKIKEGKTNFRFSEYRYDELNGIVTAVLRLSDEVGTSMRRLEREKSKIEYILSSMSEGFVVLDDKNCVLTINPAARALLGCEETEGRRNFIHYCQNLVLMDALEGEGEHNLTLEMGARVVSAYITRVQSGIFRKNHSGTAILLLDVTDRHHADRVRREFFSNASHELKTPITSIRGYAELLQAGLYEDPAQQQDFISRILAETGRMSGLISDILMISKLESGTPGQEQTEVSLKPLLERAAERAAAAARKNGVTVSCDSDDVVLWANPQQLEQIADNLLGNAVNYNRPGGSVTVTCRAVYGGVSLVVSDTGIGIPPASRERVFERFYRVDRGRSKKIGGTGLGLSIVKHIVQYAGGTVTLDSEPGQGTAVTVFLPVQPQQQP